MYFLRLVAIVQIGLIHGFHRVFPTIIARPIVGNRLLECFESFTPISQSSVTVMHAFPGLGGNYEADMVTDKGMPDKLAFHDFYVRTVQPGAEITLEQFITYDKVEVLLADQVILSEDVEDMWISAVGDAVGLNEEECYEMLCMVIDLPDPDDMKYLDEEFQKLCGNKNTVTFTKFLTMEDVQDMLNNDAVTMEEITSIWIDITGDLNTPVDRKLFGRLNIALDDYIEEKESMSDEDNGDDEDEWDLQEIYDPNIDPKTFFDEESLDQLTNYFIAHADDGGSLTTGKFSYASFLAWEDIMEMKEEECVTDDDLTDVWREAANGELWINYDRFLRLNVHLDLFLDDDFSDDEGDDDDDAESFYRSEFITMTGNAGSTMSLATLLEWKEIKDLIEDGVVTQTQITKMFESIPKAKNGATSQPKNAGASPGAASEGISQDAFVELNGMLDELLERLAGN